ncbi:hypothetical protein AB0C07_07650 [Actinoplanes missouriensis]|uniref:hypothetical protein n=1 Tax=Actinoplanes missouriensis TaxID=1866 RepID=UPI0033C5CD47
MTNPFAIPGQRDPRKPLNPVEDSQHDELFIDVDSAKEAFEEFQSILDTDHAFDRGGAMAIAVADKQFGKTALLNRCAYWMKREIGARAKAARSRTTAHIIDLRFLEGELPAALTAPERVNTVCHHLMKKLHGGRHLAEAWQDEGQREARLVLPYLAELLVRDTVLIVMLPRTDDVIDELLSYANLVPKRVVMLAETSYVGRLEEYSSRLKRTATVPVLLRLGTLRPEDGEKFYNKRRERHASDRSIAEATPEDLRWLVTVKPTSVGELQQLLYGLYDDVRRRRSPAQQLTRDVIAEFYISRTRFGGDHD